MGTQSIGHSESRALVESIASLAATPYTDDRTMGVVAEVVSDGTIWVRFKGSTDKTPCVQSSVAVKAGDTVTLSVKNGRSIITGNLTSPSTDNTLASKALDTGSSAQQTANMARTLAEGAIADAQATKASAVSAQQSANEAKQAAVSAQADAAAASTAANQAVADAATAYNAANDAATAAGTAKDAAGDAMTSAQSALTQLGTVQDVMGTMKWIEQHQVFKKADSFRAGETYYIKVGNTHEKVTAPSEADLESYYVYDHQATMAGFVQQHLTLTERGLYITQSQPSVIKAGDTDCWEYKRAESIEDGVEYWIWTMSFVDDGENADTMRCYWEKVENPRAESLPAYYTRTSRVGGIRSNPDSPGYMLLTGSATEIYGTGGSLLARYGKDGIELFDIATGKSIAGINDESLRVERELSVTSWVLKQRDTGNMSMKWKEA